MVCAPLAGVGDPHNHPHTMTVFAIGAILSSRVQPLLQNLPDTIALLFTAEESAGSRFLSPLKTSAQKV
jgi:hypothetical protein